MSAKAAIAKRPGTRDQPLADNPAKASTAWSTSIDHAASSLRALERGVTDPRRVNDRDRTSERGGAWSPRDQVNARMMTPRPDLLGEDLASVAHVVGEHGAQLVSLPP